MIDLKELDSDLVSAGIRETDRAAAMVLAKHVNAAIVRASTDVGKAEIAEARRKMTAGDQKPAMIRVDCYTCEVDGMAAEVERAPGTDDVQAGVVGAYLQDELAAVAPACPTCEREMTLVNRKLRRVR